MFRVVFIIDFLFSPHHRVIIFYYDYYYIILLLCLLGNIIYCNLTLYMIRYKLKWGHFAFIEFIPEINFLFIIFKKPFLQYPIKIKFIKTISLFLNLIPLTTIKLFLVSKFNLLLYTSYTLSQSLHFWCDIDFSLGVNQKFEWSKKYQLFLSQKCI